MSRHHTLFIPSHLCRLLRIQVEMCSLTALSASLQTFSLQASPSDWAFKLKYRRPPTYPACCFLCKWCCVFKNSFILNPYFILPDINPVFFWQQGRQHSRGMPVAEAAFDPSSQPHTWVMMALLVALSLCTPSLSLPTPPMNAVIDGQWRHPCLMCLKAFRGDHFWSWCFVLQSWAVMGAPGVFQTLNSLCLVNRHPVCRVHMNTYDIFIVQLYNMSHCSYPPWMYTALTR